MSSESFKKITNSDACSSRNSIRILVRNAAVADCGILILTTLPFNFDQNAGNLFWSILKYFDQNTYWWKIWKIYFHQNTCENFEGFQSEFFKNWIFDQNSGNLMENLKNLDQNTGEKFERFRSKFWWSTSQMTVELFKNWISIRILLKILKDFDQ